MTGRWLSWHVVKEEQQLPKPNFTFKVFFIEDLQHVDETRNAKVFKAL